MIEPIASCNREQLPLHKDVQQQGGERGAEVSLAIRDFLTGPMLNDL